MRVFWIGLFSILCSCAPGARYFLKENNDYFKPTKNRDVNFTQGLKVGATDGTETYYLQHTFYTPVHKHEVPPRSDERPYAGVLVAGYERRETSFQYGIAGGVVGPAALGKQVQRRVHKILGQGYPAGWDYQLDNRAAIILTAKRDFLYRLTENFDVNPFVGVNGGSIFNQSFLGITFRFGPDLPSEAVDDPLFPRVDLSYRDRVSYYVFITPAVRNVYYNYLLTGVDAKPVVGEGRIGFVIKYQEYDIGYTYIIQTKEFETEDRGMDWGEVSMGVAW